ncbi:MAG: hypothetical protein WCE21_01020 [Candidatus Babeliales bacterium]
MKKLIAIATVCMTLNACAPTFTMQQDHMSFMGLSEKESKPALCFAFSVVGLGYYAISCAEANVEKNQRISLKNNYQNNRNSAATAPADIAKNAIYTNASSQQTPKVEKAELWMSESKRRMYAFGVLAVATGSYWLGKRYGYIS